MNTTRLKAHMLLNGDTTARLAEALGIYPTTLSSKINGNTAEFTQKEIETIKRRYNLSPKDVDEIFFASPVSD